MLAAQVNDLAGLLLALDECEVGQCYRLPADDPELVNGLISMLHEQRPGQVARLDFTTSLLSNLRVWENLVLPAWYHGLAGLPELEQRVLAALRYLQLDDAAMSGLLDSLPSMLTVARKRELLLIRTLVLAPHYVLVDPAWCAWIDGSSSQALWAAVVERSVVLMLGGESGQALPTVESGPPTQE